MNWAPLALDNFGGINYSNDNTKLKDNQSPLMYNYIPEKTNGETSLTKRSGSISDNVIEVGSGDVGCNGLNQYYNADVDTHYTIAKFGNMVYSVQPIGNHIYKMGVDVAGDDSSQLSDVTIKGATSENTDSGVLYWELTNDDGKRTVNIYKSSSGGEDNLVAAGSVSGDGTIILAAENSSGISGSLTVAYTADDTAADTDYDTDLESNTLTFQTLDSSLDITFENWLGRYYFTDGINLYAGEPYISKITLKDEDGEELTGQKPSGKYVLQHYQRLWWIGGNSTPFFSVTDFPDRYQTLDVKTYLGCSIACDEDDGTNVVGGVSYREKLILFKPYKMFIVIGDYALDTLEVTRYATVGAYDQKGICACGDGYVRWYGPDGVYQYYEFTGYAKISEAIDDELDKIDLNMREKVCVGWHKDLFLMFYSYNSTTNNRGIAYDPKKQEWYPIRGWNICQLAKFGTDNTLHGGCSDSGYIKQLFTGTHDDGAEIVAYFQTKTFISAVERCLDKIRVGNANGETGMTITWISDYRSKSSGMIIKAEISSLGDKLSDVNNISDGGFMLEDSCLVNEDDIILKAYEVSTRLRAGQRFQEIYFIFEESSIEKHQINYFFTWSYPTRSSDVDGVVSFKNVDT